MNAVRAARSRSGAFSSASGPPRNPTGWCRSPAAALAPARAAGSNENGWLGWTSPETRLRRSNGCKRVAPEHVLLAARRRDVEGVEQLAERHGRWTGPAGRLVGARVGDDEVLGGGEHRVEQQLTVLAARVALAGERRAGQHVVAVDDGGAREDAVVEAEQAHHPMGHRAHRHHGADRERAAAEVGPRRPAGQPLRHQRAHVGQAQLGRLPRRRPARPARAAPGPAATPRPRPTSVSAAMPSRNVSSQWSTGCVPLSRSVTCAEPVDQLGQPPGEVDARGADVVERQRGADPALRVVRDRHAREHAVEPEPPGVLHVVLEPERAAVLGVVRPADAGLLDPRGDGVEVVVRQPEPASDRLDRHEVEHPAGLGASVGEVEQDAGHGEQRVGLGERTGRRAAPAAGARGARSWSGRSSPPTLPEPERRLDERGVGLDVGAHDEDVARLERGIVGEQAEQRLAEHLDLTGRAVAGVHLHAAIGGVECRALRRGSCSAAMSCCSQPSRFDCRCRRRRAPVRRRRPRVAACAAARGRRAPARRAAGAPTRSWETSSDADDRPVQVGQPLPQRVGRVRQPQVHVAVTAEGAEQLEPRWPRCGCGRTARTGAAAGSPRDRTRAPRAPAHAARWASARRPRP